MTPSAKLTGQTLIDRGVKPQKPHDALRAQIIKKISEYRTKGYSEEELTQLMFPNTILEFEALEALISALIAGNHVLFFGPPGSGKTNLAKDVWNLFPKEVYVVDGCPVQEDPFSLFDPEFSELVLPCPFCRTKFGELGYDKLGDFKPEHVDPATVPVRKTYLREGHGFARLQGSSEVFPDNLTGAINIHRLEEVGDPMSPLVLEPGKLLQANRGILLVDEIGKLPLGTQNVLLQAMQEDMVSPAKSRESFPASFIAICTSNLNDLDNINEPLNDRLSNIYVGFNTSHTKNRLIVDLAFQRLPTKNDVFIPEIFIDTGVFLIEKWRKSSGEIYELSEVGSNRAMIDIILRSAAYTRTVEKETMDLDIFKKGVVAAMLGRVRARGGDSFFQNRAIIEDFVRNHFEEEFIRAARRYWCTFFTKQLHNDKKEGIKTIEECKKVSGSNNPTIAVRDALARDTSRYPRFRKFATYIMERELYGANKSKPTIILTVLGLLTSSAIFECKDVDLINL
jgi:MoxR-like ATPase